MINVVKVSDYILMPMGFSVIRICIYTLDLINFIDWVQVYAL